MDNAQNGYGRSPRNTADNEDEQPVQRFLFHRRRPRSRSLNSLLYNEKKMNMEAGLVTSMFLLAMLCLSSVMQSPNDVVKPKNFRKLAKSSAQSPTQNLVARKAEEIVAQRMRNLHTTLANLDIENPSQIVQPMRVNVLLTEQQQHQRSPSPARQSVESTSSPTSSTPSAHQADDPSLMDYDAIDAYWHMDIEQEKGFTTYDHQHRPTPIRTPSPVFQPAEEEERLFERDIQLLTEKSLFYPTPSTTMTTGAYRNDEEPINWLDDFDHHFDTGHQKWEKLEEQTTSSSVSGGSKGNWWQNDDLGFNEQLDGIPLLDDEQLEQTGRHGRSETAVHPQQPCLMHPPLLHGDVPLSQARQPSMDRTPSPFEFDAQDELLLFNSHREFGEDSPLVGMDDEEADEKNSATEAILSDMIATIPLLNSANFGGTTESLEPILDQLNRTSLENAPSCSSSSYVQSMAGYSNSYETEYNSVRCPSTTSSGFGSLIGTFDDGISIESSTGTLLWEETVEADADEFSRASTSASLPYRMGGKLVPEGRNTMMVGRRQRRKRCSKYDYERELAEKLEMKREEEVEAGECQDEEELCAIRSISKQNPSSSSTKQQQNQRPKSKRGRKSKDNSLANEFELPYTADQLSAMPYRQYSELMHDGRLSAQQKAMIKKIRRRGRNKLAAQKCRDRRLYPQQEEDESIKEEEEEDYYEEEWQEEQQQQLVNPADVSLFASPPPPPPPSSSSSPPATAPTRAAAVPVDHHQLQQRREAYSEFVRHTIRQRPTAIRVQV